MTHHDAHLQRGPALRLGNSLNRTMYRLGVSDVEIARRAGMSRAQLNRLRNGRATPRVRTALQLAHVLGCRVNDLFFLSGHA